VKEAEWLACTDPSGLLTHLGKRKKNPHSQRKLRLAGCACCRRIRAVQKHKALEAAVGVMESHVDGKAPKVRLNESFQRLRKEGLIQIDENAYTAIAHLLRPHEGLPLHATVGFVAVYAREGLTGSRKDEESRVQSELLRDIFGNPFRPVTIDPAWRTVTVTSLAQAIYDERAFDRMPILADALEDAGCTNAEVLNHCRQPVVHVRGCWVVDLLLAKE
jgi:hypothetical protein